MQYRLAKKLHNEDQVTRKNDRVILIVQEIQVFGQYKKVMLHCVTESGTRTSVSNDEVC